MWGQGFEYLTFRTDVQCLNQLVLDYETKPKASPDDVNMFSKFFSVPGQ